MGGRGGGRGSVRGAEGCVRATSVEPAVFRLECLSRGGGSILLAQWRCEAARHLLVGRVCEMLSNRTDAASMSRLA